MSRFSSRSGFSIPEALAAIAIMSMIAAVLLTTTHTAVQTVSNASMEVVAEGIAEQLMEEIAAQPYVAEDGDPYEASLGAGANTPRIQFDEMGDYHGYAASPPADPWGVPLGKDAGDGTQRETELIAPAGTLEALRLEAEVYYVADHDFSQRLPNGQTSSHRAVETRVFRTSNTGQGRLLARLRRVFAYVPGL